MVNQLLIYHVAPIPATRPQIRISPFKHWLLPYAFEESQSRLLRAQQGTRQHEPSCFNGIETLQLEVMLQATSHQGIVRDIVCAEDICCTSPHVSLWRLILNIVTSFRISHNLKDEPKQSMLAPTSFSIKTFRDQLSDTIR